MKKAVFRIAISIAALAFVAVSLAGTMDDMMRQEAMKITSPNLAIDLKLSGAQISQRGQIMSEYQARYEEIAKGIQGNAGSADDIQGRLNKLLAATSDRLIGILTPSQKNRLRQVAIQEAGTDVLDDPSIATELGLTAAQKVKIAVLVAKSRKAQADYENALGDALDKIGDPGSDTAAIKAFDDKVKAVTGSLEPRHKQAIAQKVSNDKQILALMTPKQRNKWAAMRGKPLKPG